MGKTVYDFLQDNADRYLAELVEFATIASVSTDSAYGAGMTSAAHWVADQLTRAGIHKVQTFAHSSSSGRLRRMAGRAERADDPGLRPL